MERALALSTLYSMNWKRIWCKVRGLPDNMVSRVVYTETYGGGSTDGLELGRWERNLTLDRISAGLWQVAFNTPHPDGVEYSVSVSAAELFSQRDNPKAVIVAGTKTANGFRIMFTVDDNGGAADILTDVNGFSLSVNGPTTILTNA